MCVARTRAHLGAHQPVHRNARPWTPHTKLHFFKLLYITTLLKTEELLFGPEKETFKAISLEKKKSFDTWYILGEHQP